MQRTLTGMHRQPRSRQYGDHYSSLILLFSVIVVSGEDGTDNKIIGGELAQVGEFPFIVSLQMKSSEESHHICGGSLLHNNVALTACHCIVNQPSRRGGQHRKLTTKPASDFTVVGGIVNLAKTDFSSYRKLEVNNVTQHPKCERPETGWNWDFGLVKTEFHFPVIPEKLQTIDLPKFPELPGIMESLSDLGVHCVGAGWGVTDERATQVSPQLLKVDLKLLPLESCEEKFKDYAEGVSRLRFKPEAQVCTLGEDGKDACRGDSGGPLLCDTSQFTDNTKERGETLELIATVSWGIGCGRPDVPGAWARLDVAYDWIVNTTEEFLVDDHSEGKGYYEITEAHQKKTTTGDSLASANFLNVLVELIWITQGVQFCAIVHVN